MVSRALSFRVRIKTARKCHVPLEMRTLMNFETPRNKSLDFFHRVQGIQGMGVHVLLLVRSLSDVVINVWSRLVCLVVRSFAEIIQQPLIRLGLLIPAKWLGLR